MSNAPVPARSRPVRRSEVFAWAMYDWANSAYSALSITILVVYLTNVVFPGKAGELIWGWGLGLTMFCAAILSPVLGAVADARATKRLWLSWTTLPAAFAAAALCFVPPDNKWLILVCFLIANLGYELSQGFYNAFLPEIADDSNMNRYSSWGFALGYVGGGVALAVALVVIMYGDSLGLATATADDRDYVYGPRLSFAVEVPPGEYHVDLRVGARDRAIREQATIQGRAAGQIDTLPGEWANVEATATVDGSPLSIALDPAGERNHEAVLNRLSISGPSLARPLVFDFGPKEAPARRGSFWVTPDVAFAEHGAKYLEDHAKEIPPDDLPPRLAYGWQSGEGETLRANDCITTSRLQIGLAIMGFWWALFSLPALFLLHDRATPRTGHEPLIDTARRAFGEVGTTLRNVRRFKMLFVFLLAFLIYNDGVQTIITQASVFAQSVLGIPASGLVQVVLMIQFVAMPGAIAMGWLADRIGQKTTLMICIGIYIAWLIAAFFIETVTQFWMMGVVVALVMGGIQSVSRAIMGRMTPPSRSAEFFGFFNLSGKATSVVGPILFSSILAIFDSPQLAILSLLVFFLVGGGMMLRVNVDEGQRVARLAENNGDDRGVLGIRPLSVEGASE